MQQSMPAHLRKYAENSNGYVPQHAQQEIAQYMQKSMPSHLKRYAKPYMQQSVMAQQTPSPATPAAPSVTPGQTIIPGPASGFNTVPPPEATSQVQDLSQPQPAQSAPPAQNTPPSPNQEFDFITNPETPKRGFTLPGSGSQSTRILLAAAGLLVVIIVFTFVKSLLGGNSNLAASFMGVIQDQQEIIHLVSSTTNQQNQSQNLSSSSQNFAITAQLSIASAQNSLGNYLVANGQKVNTKELNLKVNPALDAQLTNAATAGTYDTTFRSILTTQLNLYINDMRQTYAQTKGKHGRALLNGDYNQAQLLLTQLGQPSTS